MNKASSNNVIILTSSEWQAEIAVDIGANLYRLRHFPSELELLRSPDSLDELRQHPQIYGTPVLFPPNRISDGKFTWQGRQYAFPVNEAARNNHIHGPILGKPWNLIESNNDSATMKYEFSAIPGYPHDFTLILEYRLTPEAVIQDFRITNRSKLSMPFGLGFHTAFKMYPDSKVRVTAGKWRWEIVEPRFLPSGKLLPWHEKEQEFTDNQAASFHCPVNFEIIDGKPFRGAIIEHPEKHVKIYYEIDEKFRHWCLWNNSGGHSFFCPEPMTWMIDAPNLDLPPEVTGIQSLEPGESWQAQTEIHVM